jgi:hypothetical protein
MKAIFAPSVRARSESRAVTPLELFFDLVSPSPATSS